MKKNFLKYGFAVAFALVAGYGIYASQQEVEMSDLAMANVEALANGESGGNRTCYKSITTMEGSQIFYCQTCDWVPGTNTWYSGTGKC